MSEFLIYQTQGGKTQISVVLENETLWLSQKQLTELFGKAKGTISEHIKHIFEEGELQEDSVVRYYRTIAADGKNYEVAHYNFDMGWPWVTGCAAKRVCGSGCGPVRSSKSSSCRPFCWTMSA